MPPPIREESPARNGDTCWMTDLRCPRCGSALNTNGRHVWCSFVGGGGERACSYGLDAPAPLPETNG